MSILLITDHTSELITGSFTLLGTVLGALIVSVYNMKVKNREIEAENKRASVDYLLQKEAEVLINLLETGENAYVISREYASKSSNNELNEEIEVDANEALDDFERSVRKARAFLSDDDLDDVTALLGSVRTLVYEHNPNSLTDRSGEAKGTVWRDAYENFDGFTSTLQNLLKDRIEKIRNEDI